MTQDTIKKRRFKLMTRKRMPVPTVWGWIILCVCFFCVGRLFLLTSCVFLSYHNPIEAEAMIIEGWVPDYVLKEGLAEFDSAPYRVILTTGGPMARGEPLSEYKTYAELCAATLKALGADPNEVVAIPAPYAPRHRTRTSAVEASKWLGQHPDITALNLMTLGPHARRSYEAFRQALPERVKLGVFSVPNENFDRDRWWTTSAGVRTMISEGLAYLLN